MSDNPKIDEISGTETTGHEWDGIEELNTPMPRWWLWIFYATIIWGIGYAILMPSIPLLKSHTKGFLGHSDRANVIEAMETMNTERYENLGQLATASFDEIKADPELFRYAMAAGKSAFGDNCATCHGSGAQGFKGYPNLNDDIWIWGGRFEDIRHTLTVGIRAGHEATRFSIMMAYGRDGIFSTQQIDEVTEYVLSIANREHDADLAKAGAVTFANQCASCHGDQGYGDRNTGAPNLTDIEWIYGGERADIYQSIYYGRKGVMPNWNQRLSPEMITALSVYVHSLGGGEEASKE